MKKKLFWVKIVQALAYVVVRIELSLDIYKYYPRILA